MLSVGITQGGHPHGDDLLELSGSDGFLYVRGILGPREGRPRLEMHRGARVHTIRDLPHKHTANPRLGRDKLLDYADRYLSVCEALAASTEVTAAP